MAEENKIPPIKFGQSGDLGLRVLAGNIYEEDDPNLQWPYAMQTYKRMMKDATIAPALQLVEMAIARVPWVVKVPVGKEDELKTQTDYLKSVMKDLDGQTWGEFIRQAATHNSFGFAATEKVFRYRRKDRGSKFTDGLIGLKKLAPIPQDTIMSWEFDATGKDFVGLQQVPAQIQNSTWYAAQTAQRSTEPTKIPRKKFLLFRNMGAKNNPQGMSPLNSCYTAWRYKVALEQFESTGVSQDMRGLKVMYLPPQYLDPNASQEDKDVREYYERGMTNLHRNEQSALILPMYRDENGNKMFEFDVVSVRGQNAHDVDKIITRYKKEIITSLMAGQLILGQEGGGSYSLAESLDSVTQMVIDTRLTAIKDQLNNDLIPQLFELNGWDITETPYFDYGEVAQNSLDDISKFVQRIGAVGLLPQSPTLVNFLTERLGVDPEFKGDEEGEDFKSKLTNYESGAGEGMTAGTGNGTSKKASGRDNTTANRK